MKVVLIAAAITAISGAANAAIPLIDATCGKIKVHADAGGPISINGKEAKQKVLNDNAYEATRGKVTVSLTINPDGAPSLSYTRKGGASGVCTITK